MPTPSTMRVMVKSSPAVVRGRTSRKPTVATVVTVWYRASIRVNPSIRYPIVPKTVTISRAPTAVVMRRRLFTRGEAR